MGLLPSKRAFLVVAVAAIFYVLGAWLGDPRQLATHMQNSIAGIAGPQFGDAVISLERYHQLAGTYDGAGVEGRRITVVWATDKAYCIEGVSQSGAVEYLLGPHGHVAPG